MEKKLQRDENSKMVGGVCAGLAEYFSAEVTWIRIAFLLAVFAGFGSGIIIYIVLWIAVPKKPFLPFTGPFTGPAAPDYRVYEERTFSSAVPPPIQPDFIHIQDKKKKDDNGKLIAGYILIGVGVCFLVNQLDLLPQWFSFWKLWPLAMIIPGAMILTGAFKTSGSHTAAKEPIDINPDDHESTHNADATQNI